MTTRGQSSAHKPTVETVADLAGVSRQTVSNVIRNPERVRPETRARVQQAIDALKYRPNRTARALKVRTTNTLAYRCHQAGEIENLLLDRFLHDLCRAAAVRDFHIVLISPLDVAGELADYDQLYRSGTVDGFVLSGTMPGDERLRHLGHERIPFVSFGRNWDDPTASLWVDVDGAAGISEAVSYFWTADTGASPGSEASAPPVPGSIGSSATARRSAAWVHRRSSSSVSTTSRAPRPR